LPASSPLGIIVKVKLRRCATELPKAFANPDHKRVTLKYAVRLFSGAAWCLFFSIPSWAEAPFSFDDAPGRLPKDVAPIDYTTDIVPDAKALTLSGHETVVLQFRTPTATVQFNSLNETLQDVRLDDRAVNDVATDEERQL
jgi:aminopeptidase N